MKRDTILNLSVLNISTFSDFISTKGRLCVLCDDLIYAIYSGPNRRVAHDFTLSPFSPQMASFPDSEVQTCPLCKELCGSSAPISSSSSTSSSSSQTSNSSTTSSTRRLHVLPCLHAFCRSCLESLRSNGDPLKLRCPTCDQKVPMSESGVDALPSSNFLFSNLLDVVVSAEDQGTSSCIGSGGLLRAQHVLSEPQCSSCDEGNGASSHCLDCQEYLCDNCVRAHQRVRLTKDHFIESLAENLHMPARAGGHGTPLSLSQAFHNFSLLPVFQDRMDYCQQHDNAVSP